MAGLNDLVDEDLDGSLDPSDSLITPPNTNVGKEKEVTIVTPDHPVDEQRGSIDKLFKDAEAGELPNLDIKFKLLERGRSSIVELKEIEQALINEDAISQEHANYVDYRFGNLYTTRLTPKQFTKVPTKCGFKETLSFVGMKISQETAGLISLIDSAIDKPLEDLKQFEYQVAHTYLPYMQDQIRTIKTEFEDVLKDIEVSKNTVLPIGSEFLNIVTCPIDHIPAKELDFSNTAIKENDNLPSHFVSALETLVDSLKYINLSHFIHETLKDKRFKFDSPYEQVPPVLSLLDLVYLYKADLFEDNLIEVKETLLKTVDDMKTLSSELRKVVDNPDELNQKLLEKSQELRVISYRAGVCYGISRQIITVNTAMKEVFAFLRFCL